MPKFYNTKAFKRLNSKWRDKLATSGFVDIEDKFGYVKNADIRTIAWANSPRIHTFFRRLDTFLLSNPDLPDQHKKILKLYSDGRRIKDIGPEVGLKISRVKEVITTYQQKVLELD